MIPVQVGQPRPLGATWTHKGVNFALQSRDATRVEVAFYAPDGTERTRFALPERTGDVWHGLVGPRDAGPGTQYAFLVDGPDDPAKGLRFAPATPLVDPYAREFLAGPPPRARVIDGRFDWNGDRSPAVPWRDTVIYELHVKGFTARHPAVPEPRRGTYLGLAEPAVIRHLTGLGVTAVELLPCQAFLSEGVLTARGLVNYWGYNPIAWCAPAPQYAVADPTVEFKTMVKALHAAGIEVILDVVFNHTAEGNELGPTLSLRGIDNGAYYRLDPRDLRHYENFTGCGNTVNCEDPTVRALILDCLRYWVEEMHVDGFRFDLATVLARTAHGFDPAAPLLTAMQADPVLAYAKLIAEPWDVGPGGYQLGRFPSGWSEWNDRYRDGMRAFWRGDPGRVGDFAERFAGSSDLFRHGGRRPTAGVNFVTAHDGFTLRDLVSYNERHNEANREHNADGHANNLSWNCGVEGPTEDAAVNALRARQMKNLLAGLLLSQGVPMLLAGDEFARTQLGNNNAYCQDNEIAWVDWSLGATHADLVAFVAMLVRIRSTHRELRRDTFFKGTPQRAGGKDVAWLHPEGREMQQADWLDGEQRALGAWLRRGGEGAGGLLVLVNASAAPVDFALPVLPVLPAPTVPSVQAVSPVPAVSPSPSAVPCGRWRRVLDTAAVPFDAPWDASADSYPLAARSLALLER